MHIARPVVSDQLDHIPQKSAFRKGGLCTGDAEGQWPPQQGPNSLYVQAIALANTVQAIILVVRCCKVVS